VLKSLYSLSRKGDEQMTRELINEILKDIGLEPIYDDEHGKEE